MQPIPCAHCGNNFMRTTIDPEAPRLCNSCDLRENIRNPKKEIKMDTIDIVITVSKQDQIEIEEFCINEGLDFSEYFMNLHEKFKMRQYVTKVDLESRELEKEEAEEKQEKRTKGAKK